MTSTPRIALISAVAAAIPPARAALRDAIPDAVVWNVLDDRLLDDAHARGGLDAGLRRRMQRLIDHALEEGADGVLLTCSLYGSVAQELAVDVPVLAPDEDAFAEVVRSGCDPVLVVASVESALEDSTRRLQAALDEAGVSTTLVGVNAPAAMPASRAADQDALLTALVEACADAARGAGAIFLAQYSLAPAAASLQAELGVRVISGPQSAAAALERRIIGKVLR